MIFHGMLAGELIVSDGPLISLIITDSPPSDSSHSSAKPIGKESADPTMVNSVGSIGQPSHSRTSS